MEQLVDLGRARSYLKECLTIDYKDLKLSPVLDKYFHYEMFYEVVDGKDDSIVWLESIELIENSKELNKFLDKYNLTKGSLKDYKIGNGSVKVLVCKESVYKGKDNEDSFIYYRYYLDDLFIKEVTSKSLLNFDELESVFKLS